jgi:hypothetical protein
MELTEIKGKRNKVAFNDNEEAYDIHVFVKSGTQEHEINLDRILVTNTAPLVDTPRGLNNDPVVSDKFVYAILNEYNKYFLPIYSFGKRDLNGKQNLLKSGVLWPHNSGVYMKDTSLYYSVPRSSFQFDEYLVGSIENNRFLIMAEKFPSVHSLKEQYPLWTIEQHRSIEDALSYLNNKPLDWVPFS